MMTSKKTLTRSILATAGAGALAATVGLVAASASHAAGTSPTSALQAANAHAPAVQVANPRAPVLRAPVLPAPGVPALGAPAPGAPAPNAPALGVPAPGVPAPGVPAPNAPALGVPAPGVPAPGAPAPGVPAAAGKLAAATKVPAALVVPAGQTLSAEFTGRGVQIYTCTAGVWTFVEPAATLSGRSTSSPHSQRAVHFRGPSWESTTDGSLVTGTSIASSPVTGSIPQLLLQAATNRGDGIFGKVSYVQRLRTTGGAAPATSCTAGQTTAIPYKAKYLFYSPAS